MIESTRRTIVKTLTWRVFATAITFAAVYTVTGAIGPAIGAGVADNVLKGVTYYFHERLWSHSKYGLDDQHHGLRHHSRVVHHA